MAIIANKDIVKSDIFWAEWLDEDDIDLSGDILRKFQSQSSKTFQQNGGIYESETMSIATIEEHLYFPWENDKNKLT